MKLLCLLALALVPLSVSSQELIGKMGSRSALLVLHTIQRDDGGWQIAGEYVLLPTLARRFVDGERSPELGVTRLREGTTPILYGRPPIGELRGIWREGAFRGTRYGPAGQERERFEFSEEFPSMEGYSASVRREAKEGRYQTQLTLSVEQGRLKAFEWRSQEPGGQSCAVLSPEQRPLRGGLRFVAGSCSVTLRDVGEFVALSATGCAAQCGAEAYLEPLLIDRRGTCELLRHGAR